MASRFYNARLLRNHQIIRSDLWVENGKIISPQKHAEKNIDVQGLLISPGYIDIQINGAACCDFSSNPEQVNEAAQVLPRYGVTSFLPTVVSSSPQEYARILPLLQPRKGHGASILGLHLEGPFLNPLYAGAHAKQFLHTFENFKHLEECYGSLNGVKMVTMAPELPGALERISSLSSQNILVSAGHSGASWQQMHEAKTAGLRMATHLFNAMVPFHHRSPAVIGAALDDPDFFYSLIVDGIHLHPAAVRLAWQANPHGLILVSDAISALGMEQGTFSLGPQKIEALSKESTLSETDILAGGCQGLDACVRNFYQFTKCTLPEALEAASLKPAQLLGLSPKKGTLDIEADADFILLNESLEVKSCYIHGEQVYSFGWQE